MTLLCPYCGKPAKLVGGEAIYPHRPDLALKRFWRCYPCGAFVGCHPGGSGKEPLGTLANAALRAERSRTHTTVDQWWKGGFMTRTGVYAKLSYLMQIPMQECHIGMFDVERCLQAQAVSRDTSLWLPPQKLQSIAKEIS